MDVTGRVERFLQDRYYNELMTAAQDDKSLIVDFAAVDRFDPTLADDLLEKPLTTIEAFDKAASDSVQKKLHVRFKSLPEGRNIRIRNVRAKHMNRLWRIDATIKAASEVKPQIYEATFQCPECGADIPVPQDTNIIQKPGICECGRRGDFKLVDKKVYDIRWLQGIEPFEITSGEKPGEISIFLKEDLTTPAMQTKTDPGSRLEIVGVLRELPKRIKGKLSTKMDMYVEANHIQSSEIEFEDLEISGSDELRILELARDPQIYEKLTASIAPGIWGFEEIKEAIALQLFGGTRHRMVDGSTVRGNIHILLTGDPGIGKSITGDARLLYRSRNEYGLCTIAELVKKVETARRMTAIAAGGQTVTMDDAIETIMVDNPDGIEVLTLDQATHKAAWQPVTAFVRHRSPEKLVRIRTASGREIIGTKDHSFLVLTPDGDIAPLLGRDITMAHSVPVVMNTHRAHIIEFDLSRYITKKTNAVPLAEKMILDAESGFFIGTFLAEGAVIMAPRTERVTIATNSLITQARIISCARRLGAHPRVVPGMRGERSASVEIPSRSLARFLAATCYTEIHGTGKGSGARSKRVPEFGFFAPDEFVRGMFGGLFSGDGYFVTRQLFGKRTKNSFAIGLTTVSKALAYDILDLLAAIGIFAAVRKKNYEYRGTIRSAYDIYISGRSAQRFIDVIELIDKPQRITDIAEKDSADAVPCGAVLYDIVRKLGLSRRSHSDAAVRRTFAAMMRTVRRRNRIGRRRLERIYAMLHSEAMRCRNDAVLHDLEKIRRILMGDVVWDPVVSVEDVPGTDWVYDLSIAGNETFVANGIGVHNTVILKLVSSVVPRGRYVSGSGVSGAGLTATVVKNEAIGGWVLEAGALILCNKGLISIDEFDKMNKDDQIAMHEATSVETVSIAKASIVATLPAQTAVLAGANPKYGRFDPFQPIADQIQIPETLLSRFDLKFALRDRPDKTRDEQLADHIIATRQSPSFTKPVIDTALMRKYIAYAKQKVTSLELGDEAARMLKEFYIDMRTRHATEEAQTVSITLRQYEALLRLAEASAKIRLGTAITVDDAQRAIKLMRFSLSQLGYDYETGRIDIDRVEGGMTASKRSKISTVISILKSLQKTPKDIIAIDDIRAEAETQGVADVDDILEALKQEGSVYEPRAGFWSLLHRT